MEAQDYALITPSAGVFLGPAVVRGVMETALLIDMGGSLHRATSALAYPYRPVEGDTVLVLGQDDTYYVFGVIDGHGKTRLDFPGDVEMCAAGRLRLEARESVEVASRRVAFRADRLDMVVGAVSERFTSFYRRVEQTLRTVAGREKRTVEHESTLHATRIVRKASECVVIDGEQIKLG